MTCEEFERLLARLSDPIDNPNITDQELAGFYVHMDSCPSGKHTIEVLAPDYQEEAPDEERDARRNLEEIFFRELLTKNGKTLEQLSFTDTKRLIAIAQELAKKVLGRDRQ